MALILSSNKDKSTQDDPMGKVKQHWILDKYLQYGIGSITASWTTTFKICGRYLFIALSLSLSFSPTDAYVLFRFRKEEADEEKKN